MIADIVAEDREGRPVLLVEVKSKPITDEVSGWFLGDLAESPETIAFGMLVDPGTIRLYRRGESSPIRQFDAIQILRHYSPSYAGGATEAGHKRVLEIHIRTLVGAWLRDLAYRWKSGQPPMMGEVEEAGLLDLIRDGTTTDEVAIGGPARR
jgi:hypothetical protein